mmetsp:Transcript_291/g.400  ORF Transcript_291/g.400 Transcript_291/m.400 type:complete len:559 (+) Transcript_291:81-1757(+)|eukprot:CAMPEP_0197310978 /NCGR_PEP_ID=MMETSP0891-20130614/9505_1 /TAXON_ID=44058 ORGANISM="Aureoumbra lagunensis, Strain CCMP1510" /NCGR_SAMPLE_ID=MMETSP0891 /ASSEMBLY_ACC=CAM_ASM_000534 /LENGTH=558 /DNA_ID=CAMNT_0042796873 /DNA_START=79 /DNA_END=1755 /DNA_ORIENTATION=-
MGDGPKLVGPDIDAYIAEYKKFLAKNPPTQPKREPFYYRDLPNRKERSLRGCFHDELFSRDNIEWKLANKFFDGDIPYMYEKLETLPEESFEEFWQTYRVDAGPRADRKYTIIFYGVSGYTGSMIMEYLNRECKDNIETSIAFAGRTLNKVVAMRDKVLAGTKWANIDCLTADLSNPFDVERIVSQCRVIVNIAGPFMKTGGERLVEACIHYDTDYCDVSGETPWTAMLLEFHDLAWENGVYIVPSSAYAGGLPDILAYAAVQLVREKYNEEVVKLCGYVQDYQEKPGLVAPSGGTLETRAAMAGADEWVRKVMLDPFALGGLIDMGTREEDKDIGLTKVQYDPLVKKWLAPHVYAFFETRIVRRSNYIHHQLVNGPHKGYYYGCALNFRTFKIKDTEHQALESKKSSTSSKAEVDKLKAAGKWYGPGEGPPIEELIDMGVHSLYHMVAISESGKKVNISVKGRDGYYETARMVVEMALALAIDSPKLRTGHNHVRGGILTPGVAGRKILFNRLINSGLGFIDWSDSGELPNPAGLESWGMKPMRKENIEQEQDNEKE